jgi:hypothetical protein
MRNVTIRRCPTCPAIVGHTDRLAAELRNDPDAKVKVVDGNKGEFAVAADVRTVDAKNGESLGVVADPAAETHGTTTATAV